MIFDQYFQPSIKDYERSTRGNKDAYQSFCISGPNQNGPIDFIKELRYNKLKEALVRFFLSFWANDEIAPFLQNKIVYVNFVECHKFFVNSNGCAQKDEAPEFSCPAHEEADTKIIYHVCQLQEDSKILIKFSDTDILVIIVMYVNSA